MSDTLHEKAFNLFVAACELDGDSRRRYLDAACASDAALRDEVESLLAHDTAEAGLEDAVASGMRALVKEGKLPGESEAAEALPERIDRYRVLRIIGEGGMGTVYEAVQDGTERSVALKVVRGGARGMLRRFSREVKLLGRLSHPGIARIYDSGTAQLNGRPVPYFAMEHVRGRTLKDHAEAMHLGRAERLELIALICDAVQFAHQFGVIHRDLKPGNILVEAPLPPSAGDGSTTGWRFGMPKILDFGVARALDPDTHTLQTDVGQIVGTLPYMSPEQVTARPDGIDTRSDVYALGVITYELLTGRRPIDIADRPLPDAVRMIQDARPSRPGTLDRTLRGDIETIILKAIEKDPARRYQSAAHLAEDIRRYLRNEPIMARAPTAMYQIRMFARRNPFKVVSFAALLGLIAVFVFIQHRSAVRERSLRQEATANAETAGRHANRAMLTAADAIMARSPTKALAHLQAVPPDQRDWAWRYLWAKLNWNAAVIAGDPGMPTAVTFTARDEPRAALTRVGDLVWVDAASGDVLRTIHAAHALTVLAVSRDGTRMAAWEQDAKRIVVFATASGDVELCHPAAEDEPPLAALSGDGNILAFQFKQRDVYLMDVPGGSQRARIPSPQYAVLRLSLCDDGSTVAIGGHLDWSWGVAFFDAQTGQPLGGPIVPGGLSPFALSPDGTRAVLGGRQELSVFDRASRQRTKTIPADTPYMTQVAWSGDQLRVASFDTMGALRTDALDHGGIQRMLCPLPFPTNSSLRLDHTGVRVLAAGLGEVRMWNLQDQNPRILRGHTSYVYNTAFSSDGRWLASSAWDHTIRVWEARNGTPLAILPIPGVTRLFSLAFVPDAPHLRITLPWANTTFVHDVAADRRIGLVAVPASSMPRNPDTRAVLAAQRGNSKCVYDAGECAASSWDGSMYAEGTEQGEIVLRDMTTGRELRRMRAGDKIVMAVAFSPDGRCIASGDQAGLIRLWDTRSGAPSGYLRGHGSEVYSLGFSPDGMRLASGGNDNIIILWDVERCESVLELVGHSAYVHSVCFSPDGTQLASGSGDTTVRIWDTQSPAQRRSRFPTSTSAPAISAINAELHSLRADR